MKSNGIGGRGTLHRHARAHGGVKVITNKPAQTTQLVNEVPAKRHAPLEATEEQGLAAIKRLGLDERDGTAGGGGVGASQIAYNLAVVDAKPSTSKLRAGVTGMLVALMLTFATVAPAHAQDTSQTVAPNTATLFMPHQTGPPAFTSTGAQLKLPELGTGGRSTVFGAQLDALKKPPATTVDGAVERALDQFSLAMTHALKLDAYGLATGGPLDPARGLSDADQQAVQKALTGLLSEMPVGALAPVMAERLVSMMRTHGVTTVGLEAMRLKDLGKPGGELVKSMVEELRHERPAVLYGIAVGLAGAAGVVGYTQGTDALASLGLRPELKEGFFNDHLTAKLRAEWGPKFSDPKLTTRVEHQGSITLGGTALSTTAGVGVITQGSTFKNLEVSGFELSGSLSGTLKNGGTLALAGNAVGDPAKGMERITLSGAYLNEPWTAGATVSYFAREERTVGQLSVGYRPQKNIDWALVGTIDSKGEKYLGVGVRVGF